MMADDYDPTTENENPILDHTLDNDDDDDNTTPPPGTPGASSTPYQPGAAYHRGEEHEMTHLPTEQSETVHGPGEPARNALTLLYPDASATDLEAFMDPKTHRLRVKMAGAGKPAHYLMTEDRATKELHLNPKLSMEVRNALGESRGDKARVLQAERDRNAADIRVKQQEKAQLEANVQELPERRQVMGALRNQARRVAGYIQEIEDKVGPLNEEAIQKLKDEKRALEAEHQRKKNSTTRLGKMREKHFSCKPKSTTSNLRIENLTDRARDLA